MKVYGPNEVIPRWLLVWPDSGVSYKGLCGHCCRIVSNHDKSHRVSSIGGGGRGVECVLRGDIRPEFAQPLGQVGQ